MKRLITSLSVLLLCTSAQADSFGPNDKVLYFNSDTLITVIKNTFPQNLQLDVANKYVELMDSKGNVSIDDLRTVCGVGQLDNAKCKNFIRDLIDTSGNADIKPFYWADYVTVSPEPIRLAVYSSGDGYHKNAGLDSGEWAMTFGWMKESKFMRQYPQTKYIRGISACTNESGIKNVANTSKNFTLNEQTGEYCWCKMTGPEESAWVYNKGDGMAGGCARSCALECVSALRTEDMRRAMFTAVKLNGSNANTSDEKVIGDALKGEFKPCEFDWGKYSKEFYYESIKMESVGYKAAWSKSQPMIDFLLSEGWKLDNIDFTSNYNTEGLSEGEWFAGSFSWMNKEDFRCKYPNVNQVQGIATCNTVKGTKKQATSKNLSGKEYTGSNCWCKITYPEQSKWVLAQDFGDGEWVHTYTEGIEGQTGTEHRDVIDAYERQKRLANCALLCPSECLWVLPELFHSIGKK